MKTNYRKMPTKPVSENLFNLFLSFTVSTPNFHYSVCDGEQRITRSVFSGSLSSIEPLGSQTGSLAVGQEQISPLKSAGWRLRMLEFITANRVYKHLP